MNGSLFLFPEDPFLLPAAYARLPRLLQDLELAGPRLSQNSFLAGKAFSAHITFAGCSPHLQLEPPGDGSKNFSHITLHGPFDQVRLFTTENRTRPRCPHCRERIAGWKEKLPRWRENPSASWHCSGCGQTLTAAELDWRQYAAIGRLLLEIHHVFPGEATPGDPLMKAIENSTECSWRYGWADSSLNPD